MTHGLCMQIVGLVPSLWTKNFLPTVDCASVGFTILQDGNSQKMLFSATCRRAENGREVELEQLGEKPWRLGL